MFACGLLVMMVFWFSLRRVFGLLVGPLSIVIVAGTFQTAGTYEVTDFKRSYGSNVLEAASSSSAVGSEEVENTWKHVQKLSSVSVCEATTASQHVLQPADSVLARWMALMACLRAGCPNPKGRGRGGGRGGGRGEPRGQPRGGEGQQQAPAAPRPQPITKQTKEIQNSDRILLECKQALDNLKSDEGLEIVKPKILNALCDRLKNRLTPTLCGIYTQGYDAADVTAAPTAGMQCLESLRSYSRILVSVQDLGN
eukprot:Skav223479  [mRNA]  locus=scaffold659:215781:218059:+ [translate_table: standard]